MQQILPFIHSIAGDVYIFQQDSAAVHCAHQTVETAKFIAPDLWPPNSPEINPVDYRISDVMQDRFYQKPVLFKTWPNWSSAWLTNGTDYLRVSLMMLLTNGGRDLGPTWRTKGDISNICCNNWTWTRLLVQLNLLCFRLCIVQQ